MGPVLGPRPCLGPLLEMARCGGKTSAGIPAHPFTGRVAQGRLLDLPGLSFFVCVTGSVEDTSRGGWKDNSVGCLGHGCVLVSNNEQD